MATERRAYKLPIFWRDYKRYENERGSMISVIVPVYNVEKYLRKCIDSILRQTYTDYEIICIDDGSTDDSGKILDSIEAENDKVKVYHIKNVGVSNARNFGIEKAKGEWIAFIDSDDYVEETYLEELYGKIEDKETLVFCKKNLIFPGGTKTLSTEKALVDHNLDNVQEFYKNFFILSVSSDEILMGSICRLLFNKEIIDRYGLKFIKKLRFSEDMCFLFRYLRYVKKIRVVDKPLYNYVQTGESATTKYYDATQDYLNFYDEIITIVQDDFLKKQIAFELEQNLFVRELEYRTSEEYNKANIKRIYNNPLYRYYKWHVISAAPIKNKKVIIYFVFVKLHMTRLLKLMLDYRRKRKIK